MNKVVSGPSAMAESFVNPLELWHDVVELVIKLFAQRTRKKVPITVLGWPTNSIISRKSATELEDVVGVTLRQTRRS